MQEDPALLGSVSKNSVPNPSGYEESTFWESANGIGIGFPCTVAALHGAGSPQDGLLPSRP